MICLYKFVWNAGRNGKLHGLFVARAERIQEVMGKPVYFGEVLGKHSEVFGVIEEGDIVPVTDNYNFIVELLTEFDLYKPGMFREKKAFVTLVGYNPLEYLQEEREE